MFTNLPRPTIFAHRGASMHAPENTISAFKLAIEQSADGIELDVKCTADGHVVVIHDQNVDRTTDGSGLVVRMTLSELKKLDAGSHFDAPFQGETIPTLEEVFELFGNKTFINVELTNYRTPFDKLPLKVADLARKYNLESTLILSSYSPIALRRIHAYLPDVPIGLLAFPGKLGAIPRSRLGRILVPYLALHTAVADTSSSLVSRLHRGGYRVHVFTVNQTQDMQRLFKIGVDGIFTDDPALARQLLAAESYRRLT